MSPFDTVDSTSTSILSGRPRLRPVILVIHILDRGAHRSWWRGETIPNLPPRSCFGAQLARSRRLFLITTQVPTPCVMPCFMLARACIHVSMRFLLACQRNYLGEFYGNILRCACCRFCIASTITITLLSYIQSNSSNEFSYILATDTKLR